MERVEGVESRVDTLSKLHRSGLAEIFGQLASINNKLNTLNTKKDSSRGDEIVPIVDESEISIKIDYIMKGLVAEKLERARTREILVNMVNSLAANNSKGIETLETLVDKLESEMKILVNTQLLNEELKKQRELMTSQTENLEAKLAMRMENMEEKMISKINHLTAENRLLNESITSEIVRVTDAINNTVSSCQDVLNLKQRDGVYKLSSGIKVYCDQTTDGGGWTVFQRRKDGSVDFERKWADYQTGFGDLDGEFWLGNDIIHTLTSKGNHELRIDMEDFEGNKAFAKYSTFKVKSETEGYPLEVCGYSGNAGDSLIYHNNRKFSTTDQDVNNCARTYRGAWWYSNCHLSNLNGFYYNGDNSPNSKGINWRDWKGFEYSLKFVEMKLR